MELRQGQDTDEFLVLNELHTSEGVDNPGVGVVTSAGAGSKSGGDGAHGFKAKIRQARRALPSRPVRFGGSGRAVGLPLPDEVKGRREEAWLEAWKQTCHSNRTLIIAFTAVFIFVIIFTSVIAASDPWRNNKTCSGASCYQGDKIQP